MCLVEPSTYALEFSSMATVTAFSGASLAIAARPAMGSSRPDLVIVVRGLHPCSLYDSALDAVAVAGATAMPISDVPLRLGSVHDSVISPGVGLDVDRDRYRKVFMRVSPFRSSK